MLTQSVFSPGTSQFYRSDRRMLHTNHISSTKVTLKMSASSGPTEASEDWFEKDTLKTFESATVGIQAKTCCTPAGMRSFMMDRKTGIIKMKVNPNTQIPNCCLTSTKLPSSSPIATMNNAPPKVARMASHHWVIIAAFTANAIPAANRH